MITTVYWVKWKITAPYYDRVTELPASIREHSRKRGKISDPIHLMTTYNPQGQSKRIAELISNVPTGCSTQAMSKVRLVLEMVLVKPQLATSANWKNLLPIQLERTTTIWQ